MKGPHWSWYLVIGIAALAPAGVRLMTWQGFRRPALDPQMVQAGQTLFEHKWKVNDPLANGGDGVGPVYNANSCVACHNQSGPGGGGDTTHNVTTFVYRTDGDAFAHHMPREGVVHAMAVNNSSLETLNLLHSDLPATSRPQLVQVVALPNQTVSGNHCAAVRPTVLISQRNTPALFGANLIDAIPDRVIIANERTERLRWGMASEKSEDLPVGRALRLANGRVGHFGWKAQSASLSDFVQAACANELGLSNPGQAQPRPLSKPYYQPPAGYDLTLEQCDQMTAFVASLPRPTERLALDTLQSDVAEGKHLFGKIGCTDCHTPKVGNVDGLYSDLLLHDMGQPLEGGGSYNDIPQRPDPNRPPSDPNAPKSGEWRTPPLWGVADSAPYLHDGRAPTLDKAIELHGGQGTQAARNFASLSKTEQGQVFTFLLTLRAP